MSKKRIQMNYAFFIGSIDNCYILLYTVIVKEEMRL